MPQPQCRVAGEGLSALQLCMAPGSRWGLHHPQGATVPRGVQQGVAMALWDTAQWPWWGRADGCSQQSQGDAQDWMLSEAFSTPNSSVNAGLHLSLTFTLLAEMEQRAELSLCSSPVWLSRAGSGQQLSCSWQHPQGGRRVQGLHRRLSGHLP